MNDLAHRPRVLDRQSPRVRLPLRAPDSAPIRSLDDVARESMNVWKILALVIVLAMLMAFAIGRAVAR